MERTVIRHTHRVLGLALAIGAINGVPASAGDTYFSLPIRELRLDSGRPLPSWKGSLAYFARRSGRHPYVALEGDGEAYVCIDPTWRPGDPEPHEPVIVALRVPAGESVRGRLLLPGSGSQGWEAHAFEIAIAAGAATGEDERVRFLQAKHQHYEALARAGIPGGAWFRHRAGGALEELEHVGATRAPGTSLLTRAPRAGSGALEDTFDLFSGGRALSENLQLDRVLEPVEGGVEWRPLAELQGISTLEIDWVEHVAGLAPELDRLAACIPADQHAVFFPSLAALVTLLDEAEENGTPVLQLLEPRAEDAGVRARYERQMCLELGAMAGALGDALVRGVALTGSDPYLRTGSDVAVLFEATRPELLAYFALARQREAARLLGLTTLSGEIDGLRFTGVDSGDGRLRSFLVQQGEVVLVTNSLVQVEAFGDVMGGRRAALTALDEYVFFRDRYPRGAADETAFAILTDATIRRWCGPRWRIAASRRTRAAAVMMDQQARHLEELVAGRATDGVLMNELPVPGGCALRLTPRGVVSDVYGQIAFLTPIAELELEEVTAAEAQAYERFRTTYQERWRRFFDPVALKVSVRPRRLELDLSVMPLIAGTDYRWVREISTGAPLRPGAGDPHPEALLNCILALQRDSEAFRELERGFGFLEPELDRPLSWLGDSVSIYVDQDPLWTTRGAWEHQDSFLSSHYYEIPIALHAAVRNPLRLAAFLEALGEEASYSAPGRMALFNITFHYAVLPDALVVSLREDVVQRAVERSRARIEAAERGDPVREREWLGQSWSLRARRGVIEAVHAIFGDELRQRMQTLAWSNLPILDEWRRLFPEVDPIEFHARYCHVDLVCPGGGEFVWNEEWRAMESSFYGHPGQSKGGPSLPAAVRSVSAAELGLTFERDGLRARVVLERDER